MKLLFVSLFLTIFLQESILAFDFNNFFQTFLTTTRKPPTTTPPLTNSDYCLGQRRTWSNCSGNPLMRHTTDNCTRRTQDCQAGSVIADAFFQSFMAPSLARPPRPPRPPHLSRPPSNSNPTCNHDSNLNGGSLGNCNVQSMTGRRKRQSPNFPNRDIMFLLDESGSVGATHFEQLKRIASAIVKLLCGEQRISLSKTRVGVSTFSSQFRPHIILEEKGTRNYLNFDADGIVAEINNIPYSSGSTCLGDALLRTQSESFSDAMGGRGSLYPNFVQEIILLSDGCANCGGSVARVGDRLVADSVGICVIGVGLDPVCERTLRTLGQGGKCYHFFFMDDWDQFEMLIQGLLRVSQTPNFPCILGQLYNADRSCVET